MRRSPAHTLLSLFTSRQHAAEIEGDLIEEAASRGRAWFAYHLIGITFALFLESCKEAPLRLALLSVLATAFTLVMSGLLERVFIGPRALVPSLALAVAAFVALAFLTGLALAWVGARLGMRAATCTAILLTLWFIVKAFGYAQRGEAILSLLRYLVLSIAISPLPFMTGSILGHRLRSRK
jgi:hypothetical protein